jgi:hypothetical protein
MPLNLSEKKHSIVKWTILPTLLLFLLLVWGSCWPGLNFSFGAPSAWYEIRRFSAAESGEERRGFRLRLGAALLEIDTGAQPLGPCGPRPHRGLVFGHKDYFASKSWTVTLRTESYPP